MVRFADKVTECKGLCESGHAPVGWRRDRRRRSERPEQSEAWRVTQGCPLMQRAVLHGLHVLSSVGRSSSWCASVAARFLSEQERQEVFHKRMNKPLHRQNNEPSHAHSEKITHC
ncbi:Receptor-Type Tyrosine-Protein Phosphatase Mu [Manis pentadactyla]|nr:Receptor-Type Tyrosine-Protein Phosphatase Mu [Manis pentadactyla]